MKIFPTLGCRSDFDDIQNTPLSALQLPSSPYEVIRESARLFPDKMAIGYLTEGVSHSNMVQISYQQLLGKIHQAANAFRSQGITENDTITILLPNCLENHYCIWGGQLAGIINPVNPFLEAGAISEMMNATGSKVLVTLSETDDPEIWNKALEAAETTQSLEHLVYVSLSEGNIGTPLDEAAPALRNFDELLSSQNDTELLPDINPSDDRVASYFHTGGTTGSPKIARHSYSNQVFMAHTISQMLKLTESDLSLGGLPLFHVNAIYTAGLALFSAGASVLILGPHGFRNRRCLSDFWNIVAQFNATMVSGVPTVYSALLSLPKPKVKNTLRVGVMGAAPASPELFKQVREGLEIELLEGYGLTEGTCLSSVNPYDGEKRVGSIGLSIPYQEMKAVELDGNGKILRDCAIDESGILVIRGPNVFEGYLKPEANQGVMLDDGWLNTGDIGKQDQEGYFWLTGRAKDLIIRSGHNIDPKTIEDTLSTHPDVALVAAIGQPDAYAGELPCAYVTLKSKTALNTEMLLEYARERILERAAVPVYIEVLEDMPTTAVGKIFKPSLRALSIQRVIQKTLEETGTDAETAIVVDYDPKSGFAIETSQDNKTVVEAIVSKLAVTAQITPVN